jgi:hypothetical protein
MTPATIVIPTSSKNVVDTTAPKIVVDTTSSKIFVILSLSKGRSRAITTLRQAQRDTGGRSRALAAPP